MLRSRARSLLAALLILADCFGHVLRRQARDQGRQSSGEWLIGGQPNCPCIGAENATGSYCAAWSSGQDCSVANETVPACSQRWCYISATVCRFSRVAFQRGSITEHLAHVGDGGQPSDRYVSYETCGSSFRIWDADALKSQSLLRGRELKVAIPTVNSWPIHFKRNESTGQPILSWRDWAELETIYEDDSISFEGAMIDYLNDVLQISSASQFDLTFVSGGTRTAFASPWTAMVAEVEAGNADVGASTVWMTEERLDMTAFTVPIFNDEFYLFVAAAQRDSGLLANASKVLAPFDVGLWLLIILVVLISGCLNTYLTALVRKDDEAARVSEGATLPKRGCASIEAITFSTYQYAQSYLNGQILGGLDSFDDQPLAVRILNFGFAFFVLIALSAYTANLAAFLTQEQSMHGITSLARAVTTQAAICAPNGLAHDLTMTYGDVNWRFGQMDTPLQLTEFMAARKCAGLVSSPRFFQNDEGLDQWRCERHFAAVGANVLSVPVALPASPEVAQSLSYWMRTMHERFGRTFTDYETSYRGAPSCPIRADDSESAGLYSSQLRPINMAFTFFFYIVCAILALISAHTKRSMAQCREMVRGKLGSSLMVMHEKPAKVDDIQQVEMTVERC